MVVVLHKTDHFGRWPITFQFDYLTHTRRGEIGKGYTLDGSRPLKGKMIPIAITNVYIRETVGGNFNRQANGTKKAMERRKEKRKTKNEFTMTKEKGILYIYKKDILDIYKLYTYKKYSFILSLS